MAKKKKIWIIGKDVDTRESIPMQDRNQNEDQAFITDEERSSDVLRAHLTSEEQQQEGESSVGEGEGNATDNMETTDGSLQNSKLQQDNEDLTMKLEKINQRVVDIEYSRDVLTMENDALRKDLSDQSSECKRAKEQLIRAQEEKILNEEKSKKLMTSIEKQIALSKITIETFTKQLKNSELENTKINSECKKLEQKVKNLSDRILQDELTFPTRVKESEAYITLQNSVVQVQEEMKSLRRQMETERLEMK